MLYHELEDGMYSVTSYFFAKVTVFSLQQGSTSLQGLSYASEGVNVRCCFCVCRSWGSYRSTACSPWSTVCPFIGWPV